MEYVLNVDYDEGKYDKNKNAEYFNFLEDTLNQFNQRVKEDFFIWIEEHEVEE